MDWTQHVSTTNGQVEMIRSISFGQWFVCSFAPWFKHFWKESLSRCDQFCLKIGAVFAIFQLFENFGRFGLCQHHWDLWLMYPRNRLHENPGLWGSGSFGGRSGIVQESFGVVRVLFRDRLGIVRRSFGSRSGFIWKLFEFFPIFFEHFRKKFRIFFENFSKMLTTISVTITRRR